MRILQKTHAPAYEVTVNIRIVYHLAQQVDFFSRIFFERPERYLDGILYPVTKTKISRHIVFYASEIKNRRTVVFFPGILDLAELLHFRDNRTPVKFRN